MSSNFYNIVSEYITKDKKVSLDLIDRYLTINKNHSVLDVGGGTGIIAKKVSKKAGFTTIIDPSISLLSKVKDENIELIKGSGTDMPIKDNKFDFVLVLNTIHHIDKGEHKQLFSEIYRVLKKNGKILVLDLSKPINFFCKIFANIDRFTSGGEIFYRNPSEIKEILKDSNFNDIIDLKINSFFQGEKGWRYAMTA